MSAGFAIAADLLVAILLVATIATSVRLSRRMARMKADEAAMRATIGELIVATDSAERAIAGLRATVTDSERALAERLNAAAQHSTRLAEQVSAGEAVIARVARIAEASRKVGPSQRAAAPHPTPLEPPVADRGTDLQSTIKTARDVAARAALRVRERAA